MGKGSGKWIVLLYVACALVVGGYYYFSDEALVTSPIYRTMTQGTEGPKPIGLEVHPPPNENTPETFVARVSWGRTGMLYGIAFLVALLVMMLEITERIREARKVTQAAAGVRPSPRVIVLMLAAAVILLLIWLGVSQPNPLAVDATKNLVNSALGNLNLSKSMFERSAAPGIVIGLMLLYLGHLTIQAPQAADGEALRRRSNGMRRATYAVAAVLATAVVHTNALHLLPVPLLPTVGDADQQKAFVESIRQVAATYSVAQGTVWTLLLMAIYIPVALAIEWRTSELADAKLKDKNTTPDIEKVEKWLKESKGIGHSPPFGVALASDELKALQELVPKVEFTITELVFEKRGATGALVAVPGPATVSHKARREWAEKNGLERTVYQQLTTVAAVLSPFLTGTAMLELIDALGR